MEHGGTAAGHFVFMKKYGFDVAKEAARQPIHLFLVLSVMYLK